MLQIRRSLGLLDSYLSYFKHKNFWRNQSKEKYLFYVLNTHGENINIT